DDCYMKDKEQTRNRHSIRLTDYDYSSEGVYFVTMCAYRNRYLFGHLIEEQIQLSEAEKIVDNEWLNIPVRFPNVFLDEYVIMPNHMHGIVIVGATLAIALSGHERAGASPAPTRLDSKIMCKTERPSLGRIIGAFKSLSNGKCVEYIEKNNVLEKFGRLWQRSFYDHVIRSDGELNQIRKYIIDNLRKWQIDQGITENP
ncbi:MAG: transposase, partial [Candidatus Zixiibacteriota bacterium]